MSGAIVSGSRSTGTGTNPYALTISAICPEVVAESKISLPSGNLRAVSKRSKPDLTEKQVTASSGRGSWEAIRRSCSAEFPGNRQRSKP